MNRTGSDLVDSDQHDRSASMEALVREEPDEEEEEDEEHDEDEDDGESDGYSE